MKPTRNSPRDTNLTARLTREERALFKRAAIRLKKSDAELLRARIEPILQRQREIEA